MSTEVLAIVAPSPARRWLAFGMLLFLGGLLLYLALSSPPTSFILLAMLVVLGLGALYMSDRIRRATGGDLQREPLVHDQSLALPLVIEGSDRILSIARPNQSGQR